MRNTLSQPFSLLLVAGITFLAIGATLKAVTPHRAEGAITEKTAEATAEAHSTDSHNGGGHADPFSAVLLELGLIILTAAFGRWAALKLKQPAVLGELMLGVILGNVAYWLGVPLFFAIMHLDSTMAMLNQVWSSGLSVVDAANHLFTAQELAPGGVGEKLTAILTGSNGPTVITMAFAIWMFSNLGVILLLFMVGLESSVEEMLQVGPKAMVVAIIGVVAPFVLGYFSSQWLLPELPITVHLFMGATLCATSVGITARVFKDLEKIQTREAKIILGAAVIDDILGLIVLAVVVGIVTTGQFNFTEVTKITVLSIVFLSAIIFLGDKVLRWQLPFLKKFFQSNLKLFFPLTLAFIVSWIANLIGLATIVGAFAAGLILNEALFKQNERGEQTIANLIAPLESIFAPVFFVLMGLQVNLASFLDPTTIGLALAFIVVAILGKIISGIFVGKGLDALSVGIGMVPRGEVGLIFASIGKSIGVVTDSVFSAVVIMVMVTTLITPIGLKWSLSRGSVKK